MDRRQVKYQPRPSSSYRPTYTRPKPRKQVNLPRLATWQWRLLLALGVVVVIWITLARSFAINTINVEPQIHAAEITPQVETALKKHLGQGNLLTINIPLLTKDLMAENPSIDSVTVARNWRHGLSLQIGEREATLGWQTGGNTYVADPSGVIIGPVGAAGKPPLTVVDDSNLPVKAGQQVASSQFVTFCKDINEQLPNTGLKPTKYEIHDTTFDLYVTTNKGYQIIFDTSRPASEEIVDLTNAIKYLASKNQTPSQYIDLRVPGRAYYK